MNRPLFRDRGHPRTIVANLALPFTAVAVALLGAAPGAADDAALRDCRLAVRARQALFQDDALAPLNLGVSVRAGVAVVWGKVPSAGLGRRAEDKIRKIPGIVAVRNELHVEAADNPVAEFLRSSSAIGQRPALESLLTQPRQSPAHLTSRWDDRQTAASSIATPEIAAPSITLLAPVPQQQPTATADLFQAVERLRQADARFRDLEFDLRGGIVRLYGAVQHGADAMELAQAISKLPGAERVVIGDVRTVITLPGRQ